MALIPKPPFPNVPKLPGVPQLARSLNLPAAPPPILLAGVAALRLWKSITTKPQWGIFRKADDGKLTRVLEADSVLDFGYRNESRVSDFPVQDTAFASYNKVATPFEITLRFSKAGNVSQRATFLLELESVLQSLELFSVVTPETTYPNVNVVAYEVVRRQAKGAYFLTDVDVVVRQVRQVTPQYVSTAASTQNAQDPSAQPPTNQGKVQSGTPPIGTTFDASTSLGPSPQ